MGPAGRLIMKMSDRSVFQFTGPASLNLILSMMREGILNLLLGALLAVVPRDNNYLVSGPSFIHVSSATATPISLSLGGCTISSRVAGFGAGLTNMSCFPVMTFTRR